MQTPRKRTKNQIATTAYHEAAHAVVAYALGYDVDWIKVYDPPLENGLNGECFRYTRVDDEDEVLISLAGIVADSMYANLKNPYSFTLNNLLFRFSRDDMSEFQNSFQRIHDITDEEYRSVLWGPAIDAFFRYMSQRVKVQFLAPGWSTVQRIAQVLIDDSSVSGIELQRL